MMKRFILVLFSLALAPLAHATSCSSTSLGGGLTCTVSATSTAGTTSTNYAYSSGHTAGHVVVVCAAGNSSSHALASGNISNTLGWAWVTLQAGTSGAAQANYCWGFIVVSTTSSSDTITITNANFTYLQLVTADFTGAGAEDGAGATNGSGTGSGTYSFSSTSLPIGFGIGSATLGPGTGWTTLENGSPYMIMEYKAPGGTSANATFVTTYTSAIGIALKTATVTATCHASVSLTGAGSC